MIVVAAAIYRLRLLVDGSATTGGLDTALLGLSDWRKRKLISERNAWESEPRHERLATWP
jgi:hypothetical protein